MSKELAKNIILNATRPHNRDIPSPQDFQDALDELNKERVYKPLYPWFSGKSWVSDELYEDTYSVNLCVQANDSEQGLDVIEKHEAWLYITSAIHKVNWEFETNRDYYQQFYSDNNDIFGFFEVNASVSRLPKLLRVTNASSGATKLLGNPEFVKQYKIWLS